MNWMNIFKALTVILGAALGVVMGADQATSMTIKWSSGVGGNDHFYQAVLRPNGISWTSAKAEAEALGGYLATATSSAENNFIASLVAGNPDFWVSSDIDDGDGTGFDLGPWLGGFQPEGTLDPTANWTWVTGEPFTFTDWELSQNEPNDFGGIFEDYLHYYDSTPDNAATTWNDLRNEHFGPEAIFNIRGYIVEFNSDPADVPEPFSILGSLAVGFAVITPKRRKTS
jgi:hypothetical protein